MYYVYFTILAGSSLDVPDFAINECVTAIYWTVFLGSPGITINSSTFSTFHLLALDSQQFYNAKEGSKKTYNIGLTDSR